MRAERLFRVLGMVDPALVEEALAVRRRAWKAWAAMAACLALVICAGFGWLVSGGFQGYGNAGGMSGGTSSGSCLPEEPAADSGAGGAGIEEGLSFLSYAGPVFPLTTAEDPAGLTAERTVTWDFTPGVYPDGEPRQWGAEVEDAYTLSNPTGEELTVTALYPFSGSFDRLLETWPQVTVEGRETEAVLYAGAYSGGFQSTFGGETENTFNLASPENWTAYKTLLESGAYLEQALGEGPALDMPVTVYQFSDFAAPHEEYPAATQAIAFDIDPEKTTILTYGINGMDWDGNFRRYSYFVPDGVRNEPDLKLLIVLGEDLGPYTLEGFQDGGCDRGEEIDGVSCTVTRRETSMDAVLDQLCAYSRERWARTWGDRAGSLELVSQEMYQRAVAELLTQYGLFSAAPMDRYTDGRLDDILQETLSQDRVLYLGFPVTVPAGGEIQVTLGFWKEPSFDYACSGSENQDLQGYDLVTRLGSGLTFTRQRVVLENEEHVEVTGQNLGLDPDEGITSVDLDLEQEHYYLEIRPKEG